jgi:hyaluronan synthase
MFLCLVISVVKYLMGLILRVSFPAAKIRKDYSRQPKVSVLMPCFNEGKTVYQTIESISKSNYPANCFEVIAQDDCSVDDSYEWMLKAQRDFTNIPIRVGRNDFNCGKARTVCNALKHSQAEVIISIDSDCIFHPDAIRELTACFAEPGIGAVGGRVGVSNPNDNVITAIQTIIYYSAFELYKIPENWTRSVCCISGCLFAIRRELLLEIEPSIRARNWFGIPVNQGEDRFLTHQTLLRSYGTYINTTRFAGPLFPTNSPCFSSSSSAGVVASFAIFFSRCAPCRNTSSSCIPTPCLHWFLLRSEPSSRCSWLSPCLPPIPWTGPVPLRWSFISASPLCSVGL